MGGNQWRYQYSSNGLLHKAIDPKGQLAAKFSFGKDSKATSVRIRARKFRYKYQGDKTLVTDENADTTTFAQNAQGVTTSITNAQGFTSRIVLNARNQIAALWHNDELQASIFYDDNGRPARYDINGKPSQMEREFQQHNYQYDDAGRLLFVGDSAFIYDARGNLTQHKTDKFVRTYQYADNGDVMSESQSVLGLAATTTRYTYNDDGQLASIKAIGQTTQFEYNSIGKFSKVTFPDGAHHSYQYDKLGFRKHTKRSDTSAVDYFYDKVGNLTQTKQYAVGATVGKSNKLTINASNQVTAITSDGQRPMTIKYTAKGNPKTITQGENTTEYQYDTAGRLRRVQTSVSAQDGEYTYQKGEEDIRLQLDDRTKSASSNLTQVTAHNQTQAQLQFARMTGSPWQSVIWSEALNKLLVPLPKDASAPDVGYQSAKQRRRLRDAKSTVKQQQLAHDKPSNSQFVPVEYNIVNCDIVGDDGEAGGVNQDCYLHGVLLDAASTITAGVPYTFSAFAVSDSKCDPRYSFAIDGTVVGLSDSGYFTHTFAQSGSHTVQTNAQCMRCLGYVKWDAMEVNVESPPPSSVTLGIYSQSTLTLLDTYTLTTTVQPASLTVSNYKIEIKKAGATTWYPLYSGTSKTFSSYAKVAGFFALRTTVTVDNKKYTSAELAVEMQFPSYYHVIGDQTVQARMQNEWQTILNETTTTQRRERGFWIQLNTLSRRYEFVDVAPGPWVDNETGGTIALGSKPSDTILAPNPLDKPTYTVASFHGHTPMTFVPVSKRRKVGPSPGDDLKDLLDGITGVVYDYVDAPLGSGYIYGGHSLNSRARTYQSEVGQRSTPY
ncbi:MAG: hypothetical protein MJK04_28945 [Psychrosphaera sp.]|nr:hypothetical protein [Psychrosphaera sp.]